MKCQWCETEFNPSNSKARYCSHNCKGSANQWRRRQLLNALKAGKVPEFKNDAMLSMLILSIESVLNTLKANKANPL